MSAERCEVCGQAAHPRQAVHLPTAEESVGDFIRAAVVLVMLAASLYAFVLAAAALAVAP